jgi:ABC-type Mn2+/Zn2+ transport system permease subunit
MDPNLLGPGFLRIAAAEVLLLSVIAALVGTQVVLRRLAFFTHGVGVATFPGLVVAATIAVPAQVLALGSGAVFAGGLEAVRRRARLGSDAATAIALVGTLALGVVLASDLFPSGAGVDRLLFGSLVGITPADLVLTAAVAAATALASLAVGRRWTAAAFEEEQATAAHRGADLVLLAAVTVAVVATADAAGALLVGALLVTPAATALQFAPSVASLKRWTFALAAVEGIAGLYGAYALDVPPGPTIAALGGVIFALVAVGGRVARR